MIAPANTSIITIQFTDLNIQPGKDVLRVFQCTDISCLQEQQLAELSSLQLKQQFSPLCLIAMTGYVKVMFSTDMDSEFSWFTASWSTVCIIELNEYNMSGAFKTSMCLCADGRSSSNSAC